MLKGFIKNHPLSFRFIIWVIVPVIIFATSLFVYLRGTLPTQEGAVVVEGLSEEVSIIRDKFGVPHIFAKTDRDAFFAIGYLHAQDRIWQMDSQRRLGQGRMAEILGRQLLSSDQFMRTLGLYTAAKSAAKNLSEPQIESLRAYADGVNAWLAEEPILPIEYQFLRTTPEPWQVEDSLLQIKLMSLNLDGNYRKELDYDLMIKSLGLKKAEQVKTNYPLQSSIIASETNENYFDTLSALANFTSKLDANNFIGGESVGSNAWVVAGTHTVSGSPLIANDPHLKTQIPSNWYLAQIQGDKLHAVGATIPGIPLIMTGHNQHISWGVTALKADVQDIFLERVHPKDDDLYEVEGEWRSMIVDEQTIKVRTDFPAFLNTPFKPVKWHVRSTRHGPLISDVLGKVDTPMALRWTALDPNDKSYGGFYKLNYARDWSSFNDALRDYNAPAMNFLYADIQGNIGYTAGGNIPIRNQGIGSSPSIGWKSQGDWIGMIDKDELPRSYNPARGFIVSANNKIHNTDYAHHISSDWSPGYRASRIEQLLRQKINSGEKLDVGSMVTIQGDVKNLQAQQIVSLFRQVSADNNEQQEAIKLISNWDLRSSTDSIAASIYHAWLRHFSIAILSDALATDRLHIRRAKEHRQISHQMYPLFLNEVVNGKFDSWCDRSETEEKEDCISRAKQTLVEALDELKLIGGNDMDDWAWGKIHHTHYPHNMFSKFTLLDLVFDRKIPSGGDGYTVNVAQTYFTKDDGYQQVTAATYRSVVDLSDWQNSKFISSTGQSGNLLSPHYDNFIELHNKALLVPMQYGAVTEGKRLILIPKQKSAHVE